MPNFCAAPNCSRKSTNCPEIPFFRFPKDPARCQKWVENCRRADLENRSAEQLHKQYRLCARHFEESLICTNSPYRTVLKDNAVPTLFDLTSHLNKPEGKHRKHKMIKELSEEDLLRVKAPRTDGDVLRGLQCKQEAINEMEKTDLEGATENIEESTLMEESLNLTPEEKGNKEFLKVLFETVLLLGRQNVPLGGSAAENAHNLCNTPDNVQALLEFRMNAGDEILRKRFETTAVNAVYCPKSLQKDLLDICEMCIREEVLREVRDSNFFSIITDDVINIAGVNHVSLLIRFVDESDSLRQEFVGFIPCELDGEFLASRIHETLTEKWGLNLYYCRGQAYNGSGNMAYKKQVVVASILQQCPKALCTPCSSYPLNIWMAKSSLIFGINLVLSLMENIVSFFSLSPQLQKVFEVSINSVYQTNEKLAKELKKLFQINWYERHDTFEILADLYEVLVTCLDEISYDTCGRWNSEISTQASMLSSTMRDFEIVVSLMVLKNVLSYTRAFGKNLQGQASDTYFASSTLTAVLHSLNEMRDNIEVYHEFWLEEATNLSLKMGIEVKLPWRCRRQPQNEEVSEETPENYYKEAITAPFLDHVILEIEDMFSEQQLKALKCLSLVPSVMAQLKYNTGEENMADLYKDDLPNPDTLSAELHCWKIKWKHRSRDVELPSTIFETLRHPDIKFFPNVYTLLKIVSNLPIIKLETDKCDVGRKRLKSYLKVTPVEERTGSLALIHINYDAKHDYDMMVDTFAKLYPEKMQLQHVTDSDNVEVNNHGGNRVEINNLGTSAAPLYEVDGDCVALVSGIVLHHQSPGTILEACQNPGKNVIEVTQHPVGSTVELQQLPVSGTMIVTQHSTEHHPEGVQQVGSNVEVQQHHIEGRVVEVIHHPEVNGAELQHRSEVNGVELEDHQEEVIEVSHHSEMRAVEFEPTLEEGGMVELEHHVQGVAVALQHQVDGSTVELQPESNTVEMHPPEASAIELSHHTEESAMEVDHYPESSTAGLQQHLAPGAIELQHQIQPEPITTEILCHAETREGEAQHSLEPVTVEVQHPPNPSEAESQHHPEPRHPEPAGTNTQHHSEPVAMVTQHPSKPVTTVREHHFKSTSSEIQQHSEPSAIVIQSHPEVVAEEIEHYTESVTAGSNAAVIQNYPEPVTTVIRQHPEPVTVQIHQHPGPTVMVIQSRPGSTVTDPASSALLIQQHPKPITTEIQHHSETGVRDVHHHPGPNALELQSHLGSSEVVEVCPQVSTVKLEHHSVAGVVESSTVELENCSEADGGTVEVDSMSACTQDVHEGINILEVKNSEESNSETNISSVSNVNKSEVAVQ